jgi:hypothetical protein
LVADDGPSRAIEAAAIDRGAGRSGGRGEACVNAAAELVDQFVDLVILDDERGREQGVIPLAPSMVPLMG